MFGWSIETDDFEGRYFDQPYPLLRVRPIIFLGRRNSTLIFYINIAISIFVIIIMCIFTESK